MVSLGLITHAPQYAQHSPGKLMILLLGQLLGEQGEKFLDLTPGGTYKDLFATSFDNVAVLQVFLRPADHAKYVARRAFVAMARSVAGWFNADALEIGAGVKRLARTLAKKNWRRAPITAARTFRLWALSEREYRLYQWDAHKPVAGPACPRIHPNRVSDLLLYRPESRSSPSLTEFLSEALHRLRRGEILFSAVEEGRLAHTSWLIPSAREVGTDYGHILDLAAPCAVLYIDYTHPEWRGRGLHQESLAVRLQYVAEHYPQSTAIIGVRADNGPSRHNVEKVGFEYCGSAWIRLRLGTVTRWTQATTPLFAAPRDNPAASATPGNKAGESR
jgi:RimJ/RimL family protein N-acetyltransferase